ncbi:hypothetical protein KUTeg_017967 [Tegillarca granosa]|uniref:Uncharacterized protein n=1 Tax=Tegillarca granosa TaxID=220873 RepID=A0ABQ9EGH0_TEGGR|nr:hypothetical protein KUTeg_017967 [Tegillarca granosa]
MTTTIVAGVVSSKNNLQPSSLGGGEPGVTHGDYMDLYYFKSWCRMGPYIIGIIGGYILYKLDCKLKINKILNLCIWIGAAGVACAIVYGLYGPIKQDNPLSNDVSALYNATHRTMWGYINTLLSWKGLIPLSRLTYCAYLVHPSIMYLYYNSIRKQTELTDLTCVNYKICLLLNTLYKRLPSNIQWYQERIYLFFGHLVLSYMVAFVSSLAFESPMMGLEKVIFGGKASKKPKPPPPAYEESNITVVEGNNGYINRALDHIKPDENGYTLQQRL